MQQLIPYTTILALICSACLDIFANILLVKSKGFSILWYGVFSLLLILVAFSLLAFVSHYMNLSVAYVLWGGFGILGTSLSGWLIFGNKLKITAWIGMIFLISGMMLLHSL